MLKIAFEKNLFAEVIKFEICVVPELKMENVPTGGRERSGAVVFQV